MNYKQRSAIVLLAAIVAVVGCSQNSEMERTSTKIEKKLNDKMKSGNKLSPSEINNLSGAYLFKKQYNDGIACLEQLSNDDKYKNSKYLIYLNLSKFYLEQTSEKTPGTEKTDLIEKANRYLALGVDSAPEKASALYARSHIYGYEGCIEKAKKDLQDARNIAQGKNSILYEEGLYVPKEKFISLLQADSDSLSKLTDNCDLH